MIVGFLSGFAIAAIVGCASPYLVRQAAGQVQIMASARSVEQVQRDPATRESIRAPMEEVARALEFARESGLAVGDAYQTVVDLGSRPPVWVLYACPPDRLEPRIWSFPIVGDFPYKGFFDVNAARRAARQCQREGLETVVLPAGAYSTLGWLPDPLFSSFLESDVGTRVETLFHELTHRTLFLPGSVRLNENLADFVGELLARRFLAAQYDSRAEARLDYEADLRDRALFRGIVLQALGALRLAFESESRDERLRARGTILARLAEDLRSAPFAGEGYRGWAKADWNLALLVALDTYRGEQDVFRDAFRRSGDDLAVFFAKLRQLWSEGSDPLGDLQAWADSEPDGDVR